MSEIITFTAGEQSRNIASKQKKAVIVLKVNIIKMNLLKETIVIEHYKCNLKKKLYLEYRNKIIETNLVTHFTFHVS